LHQGLRLSRPWLALVLIAFCLPLCIGLGGADLETDEAIYSFAVDRLLETGDWLAPKSSPSETAVFLEKPPLKFWLVAAPIKAGLLPHDEFGLRFLDALAGSAAFIYVFAIGSLLAGPLCGAVAVLLLFVHTPLVFTHGLRTNNMEASLVLSYCAGTFHVLRWARIDEATRRRRHAVAATMYLVLGFMTKFVAALFLPLTLALAVLASTRTRRRLVEDWRTWAACVGLFFALCAPWFVYAHVRFGAQFWETILGEHVLRRMTAYLDPTHLHPWHYYLQQMWLEFDDDRVEWLVVAGVLTLLVQTIRRRWFEGAVVLLWGALPLAIISAATSKLYHYAYPFLPPVTLAAGYLVALVVMLAPVVLRKLLEVAEDAFGRRLPVLTHTLGRSAMRRIAAVAIVFAAALAAATVATGGLRLRVENTTLLRSQSVLRPILLIAVVAVLTRTSARVSRLVVALLVFSVLPVAAFRDELGRLHEGRHPIRTAAACVNDVQEHQASRPGLLIDVPEGIWHPLYYYFRRVQPIAYSPTPLDPEIERALSEPGAARPILIGDPTWREYVNTARARGGAAAATSPPMVSFLNTTLLLPGPYAACSSEAVLRGLR
jgi:4-amino-4-deoxy-L-arabinose transferase-like glycosyltransferase